MMEPDIRERLRAQIGHYWNRNDRAPTLIVLSRQLRQSMVVSRALDGAGARSHPSEPATFHGIRVVEAPREPDDYWAVVGD